ncbi:unnamed protein product [Trichobilharzia szidati]|nr:unnamed protein product [Trichobilharzia szidati]
MPSTVSVASFSSWASNATKCTNPAFSNALNRAWSNVSMQKDVLSVLAAVTKTIKDNGGKESPAEYYAVLLTLISESPEKVAPAYLLKLLMCKAVQDSLLRKTCGEAAKTLMSLLNPRSESSNPTLIKSVLTCLGRLLRAQSYDSWSADSVRHIYRHVLRFVDNEKPSIRKASHLAIVDILSSFNVVSLTEEVNFHPACHQTQEHLSAVIREETRQLITSLHTKDVQCTRLLHCLDLLTTVIPLLPSKDVKLACECILELANFPNPLVVTKMFHSFKTMFDSKPSLKTLPIDIAARLITALYSCRPNDPNVFTLSNTNNTSCTGVDAIISWIQALISGCTYLSGLSIMATESDDTELKQKIGNVGRFTIQQLASEHLDRLIKTLISLLTSTPIPQLREATTQKLNQLFMDVVEPQITSCRLTEILPDFISHVLSGFINSLQYTHYEIWHHLLSLIGRFIMIFSKIYASASTTDSTAFMELLKVILHLRDCLADGPKSLISLIHVDPNSFSLMGLDDLGEKIIDGLDSVCLITIEYIGPELLTSESVFSLETLVKELEAGSIDLRRSWFLPLISRAVPQKPCALSIFSKQILPLADRALSVASSTAAMTDKTKPANNALITLGIKVACQLWSSLNMFVHRSPTDWSELSTGGLGSRLVKEFNSAPALRPIILHAFRRLAKLAAGDDSATTVMRGGAKMALPAMLSLYETLDTTTQYSMKQKIQATLSYYLPIMSSKIICSVTKTAMNKFDNTNQPIYLEIFHIVTPYNSVSDLEVIVARINDYLTLEQLSKPLKKRACRVLESICAGGTSQTDEFLNSNLDNLILLVCGLTKRLVNKSSEKATTTATTAVTGTLPTTINNDDDNNTESIEKKMTKLSVCGMKLDQSSNKTAKYFIPWKPLLQCIHHLFKRLVTCELNAAANSMHSNETMDNGDLMENERLKKFANMFFPEILTCMLDLNRIIRDLAGRLLIGLVNAFAGQQPFDKNINSLSLLYGSRSNLNFDANSSRPPTIMKGIMKDSDNEDDDDDNGNEGVRQDGKSAMSLGGLTCSDDDDDDIVSTKSMQRGSVISERICRALNLVLSRLWPCLPPHNRSAENSIDLALQQSSARAICLLMKHTRFRQALVLNIDSESEEICQLVSIILNEVNLISQNLVKSPQRVLIRLGLQLSRSLIAFIQEGCISLASVLETLQSIHPTCKRPLRFVVKSILEKMIKKFGRQAIQGLLNSEHQKIVRNSAKLIARRERKSKALEKSTSKSTALSLSSSSSIFGSLHQQLSDSDSDHNSRKSLINDTKSIVSSIRSKSSRLPKRVHITRMDELLASSSDDDENNNFLKNKSQSDRASVHSRAKSIRSQTKSHDALSSKHPMSLVEELENVKQTAGLCRRSRKNFLQNGSLEEDFDMDIDIDSSEDDEAINKAVCKHPLRSKQQVRFADTISRASTTRSHLSRRSQKAAQQLASTALHHHHQAVTDSDLWLVENPNDSEILDLSDPKSLARHTAFAPDDVTAKAMVNAFRKSLVQQSSSSSEVVERSQPFPIVNGKIVIGNPVDESQLVNKKDNSEWALSDDDNDDSSLPATSHYQQSKLMKSRKQKSLQIPGRVYASTKARGDMKRRGMPEPYAFVPLGAGIGKSGDTTSQKITPLERRRLLREVGLGRQKRKRIQGGSSKGMKSSMMMKASSGGLKSGKKSKFSKIKNF